MIDTVVDLLTREGADPDVYDVRTVAMPMPDPTYHHDPAAHPDPVVQDLVKRARAADGFVLASPVYHNSYSGALKLALDHLDIATFDGKPVALCGNGGRRGSVQPCDHLRIVVRGLHGVAIPYNIVSVNGEYEETPQGFKVASDGLVVRLSAMVDQLVHFCQALGPASLLRS
jgi:NAD(P)H-dependent FMN reductase